MRLVDEFIDGPNDLTGMLRGRARNAQIRAYIALALAGVGVVTMAIVFYRAGITVVERGSLSSELVKDAMGHASREIDLLTQRIRGVPYDDRNGCVHAITDMRNRLSSTENAVQTIPKEIPLSEAQATFLIVSVLLTRIGAALLVLFVAQILVGYFKYQSALADFYLSRADTYAYFDWREDELPKGVAELLYPNVLFGNPPPTPAEQAIEIARVISDARKKE